MQGQLSTREEWRAIPGWEGRYEVSNHGRVRSLRLVAHNRDRLRAEPLIMKPGKLRHGYVRVGLCCGGVVRRQTIHTLVLVAFVGPRPKGMEAAHNNGVRDDNRAENLRWDTKKNNHADKVAHGTMVQGELCHMAKLTEAGVLSIRAEYASGGATQKRLAEKYGVGRQAISKVVNRKTWRHL
jgi:hypothetical protein